MSPWRGHYSSPRDQSHVSTRARPTDQRARQPAPEPERANRRMCTHICLGAAPMLLGWPTLWPGSPKAVGWGTKRVTTLQSFGVARLRRLCRIGRARFRLALYHDGLRGGALLPDDQRFGETGSSVRRGAQACGQVPTVCEDGSHVDVAPWEDGRRGLCWYWRRHAIAAKHMCAVNQVLAAPYLLYVAMLVNRVVTIHTSLI